MLVMAASAPANADTSDVQGVERFALAFSEPAGWTQATFGISAYTAITPHQALRANFTTHQPENSFDIGAAILLSPGGEDDGTHAGYIRDFSIGWMYFPRRVYDASRSKPMRCCGCATRSTSATTSRP